MTSAADELVDRASSLKGDQIRALADATRRRMGSGLSAYLGLRTGVDEALKVASAAVTAAGRLDVEFQAKGVALEEAVLGAAIAAATREGRDTQGVFGSGRKFRDAVASGDSRERQRKFRAFRRDCRSALGRSLARQWPTAGIGAGWALIAVISWNLVAEDSPYTVQQREALVGPWIEVAELPLL